LLFGISHGSLSAFLPLAASGVVLAYVYQRSGSLTASMISHALFNLINVALITLASPPKRNTISELSSIVDISGQSKYAL